MKKTTEQKKKKKETAEKIVPVRNAKTPVSNPEVPGQITITPQVLKTMKQIKENGKKKQQQADK